MTDPTSHLERLGLQYNPFPPATTGVAFIDDVALPRTWEQSIGQCMDRLHASVGDKALAVVGGYGSGKTFILSWIARKDLPQRRIQPYFFDNPGVAFYDLANRLMREVGRYELSKALWEMLYRPEEQQRQLLLMPREYPDWLATLRDRNLRQEATQSLSSALQQTGIATDEEIAYKFARVVVETRERPYYEYRDFVPRGTSSFVAEREEANYFRTLVRLLVRILEVDGIAFLIDEFEDVALGKRLNKRQTSEYIATLRRLLDTAREENLWIIVSMTPEGFDQTRSLDPSLIERFTERYDIPAMSSQDAYTMVSDRLRRARINEANGLHPFPEEALSSLRPTTVASPRRLIKVLWRTLALVNSQEKNPSISLEALSRAEEELYPGRIE